jgi:hypothetical protein
MRVSKGYSNNVAVNATRGNKERVHVVVVVRYQQGEDEEELAAGTDDAEEPEEEGAGEEAQLDPVQVREREHEDLEQTCHEEAHAWGW